MKSIQFQYLTMLVGALPAAFGCSNQASESSAYEIALEDYRAEFKRTLGDKLLECCTDAELAAVIGPDSGSDDPDAATAIWREMIDAGVLAYHPGEAAEHLASLDEMTCAELAAFLGQASQGDSSFLYAPFEGRAADGVACDSHLLCASEYCGYDADSERGACMAKPGVGGACPFGCAAGLCCAPGLYCASEDLPPETTDPTPAFSGICTAQKADGMSCYEASECTSGACAGGDQATLGTCGAAMVCDGE